MVGMVVGDVRSDRGSVTLVTWLARIVQGIVLLSTQPMESAGCRRQKYTEAHKVNQDPPCFEIVSHAVRVGFQAYSGALNPLVLHMRRDGG